MSLFSSHSDANIVIDEALSINYTHQLISGSWSWTAANISGTYDYMRECHRYAKKTFRYVGLTYAAAKACAAAMRSKFTRDIVSSHWDGGVVNGQWNLETSGSLLLADVSCVHGDGDEWSVHVSVNEDDVRFLKTNQAFSTSIFATENLRTYGSDGHGAADEGVS